MDRIMVVDDEPDIISLLKLVLEADGYEVVPALDGDMALQLAEIEAPDLVLLDLMMPGKSGLEICRCLKSRPRTKNSPVIIFSALGRDVDKKQTAEAGASVHITKPFNNAGLIGEVKRCLSESRSWKFARQLGTEHNRLVGKKMLLEYDPRTDYPRIVRDFALECAFLRESVIIFTQKSSNVRQTFEGDQGVKFVELERASEFLPVTKQNVEGPLSIVLDSLTDLALNQGAKVGSYVGMYSFVQQALETLNEPRITALFLLNPSAHDPKDVASVRGLFGSQFVYENNEITIARIG